MNQKVLRASYLITLAASILLSGCADKSTKLLNTTDQSAEKYVNQSPNQLLLSNKSQARHQEDFLQHYYSPWNPNSQPSTTSVTIDFNKTYLQFIKNSSVGENLNPINPTFFSQLKDNANIKALKKPFQRAITIATCNIRRLPTSQPAFASIDEPGATFPFDQLQNSLLPAEMPVRILHQTKDHAWSLIQSSFMIGWVKSSALAYVDQPFINQWQRKHYITPLKDKLPLVNQKSRRYFTSARIGNIYPLLNEDQNRYQLLIAVRNQNTQAVIKKIWVNKTNFAKWPLTPTALQFTKLINQMLGEPYGWGGLYGFRDCSATVKDLFASFGIWLPRDSKDQRHAGKQFISLANLSKEQKIQLINDKAKSLLTLINLPGHTMVYIGTKENMPYVFHNVWGLRTRRIGAKEGRLVIGRSVITPINLGEQYFNVKQSFLGRADSITIIQ